MIQNAHAELTCTYVRLMPTTKTKGPGEVSLQASVKTPKKSKTKKMKKKKKTRKSVKKAKKSQR